MGLSGSHREYAEAETLEGEGDVVEDPRPARAGELDGIRHEELGVGAAIDDDHSQWVKHLRPQAGTEGALFLGVHHLLPVVLLDEEVHLSTPLRV